MEYLREMTAHLLPREYLFPIVSIIDSASCRHIDGYRSTRNVALANLKKAKWTTNAKSWPGTSSRKKPGERCQQTCIELSRLANLNQGRNRLNQPRVNVVISTSKWDKLRVLQHPTSVPIVGLYISMMRSEGKLLAQESLSKNQVVTPSARGYFLCLMYFSFYAELIKEGWAKGCGVSHIEIRGGWSGYISCRVWVNCPAVSDGALQQWDL